MEELKVKVLEVADKADERFGNELVEIIVEIDGRKLAIWTTQSNVDAIRFDLNRKKSN